MFSVSPLCMCGVVTFPSASILVPSPGFHGVGALPVAYSMYAPSPPFWLFQLRSISDPLVAVAVKLVRFSGFVMNCFMPPVLSHPAVLLALVS